MAALARNVKMVNYVKFKYVKNEPADQDKGPECAQGLPTFTLG